MGILKLLSMEKLEENKDFEQLKKELVEFSDKKTNNRFLLYKIHLKLLNSNKSFEYRKTEEFTKLRQMFCRKDFLIKF